MTPRRETSGRKTRRVWVVVLLAAILVIALRLLRVSDPLPELRARPDASAPGPTPGPGTVEPSGDPGTGTTAPGGAGAEEGPSSGIEVLVLTGGGAPVPDATVSATSPRGVVRRVSDRDGRCSVPFGPPRTFVQATASGYLESPRIRVDDMQRLRASGPLRLELPGREAVLPGRVVGPDGAPREGVRVNVRWGLDGGESPTEFGAIDPGGAAKEGMTTLGGEFLVAGIRPGTVMVRVSTVGFPPLVREARMEPGRNEPMEIVLVEGHTLFGVVESEDGGRVPRVEVRPVVPELDPPFCTTGDGGRFSMSGLPVGPVEVHADGGPLGRGVATVVLPIEDPAGVRIRLGRGKSILGKVVDEAGTPLPGRAVRAIAGGARLKWTRFGTTERDGTFVLPDLDAGPFTLEVSPGPVALPCVTLPEVWASPAPLLIVVDSENLPSATVCGRVVVGDSALLRRCNVMAISRSELSHALCRVAEGSGEFLLGPLPPGEYRLFITSPGFSRLDLGKFRLAPRERKDLGDVEIPEPGTLRVAINPSALAVEGRLFLGIRPASLPAEMVNPISQPASGEDSFRLTPGDYEVRWQGSGVDGGSRIVSVASGTETVVDVELTRVGKSLVLFHVPGGSGATLIRTEIATPEGTVVWRQGVGNNGSEGFLGCFFVKPGEYVVTAEADSGETVVMTARFAEGAYEKDPLSVTLGDPK